MASIAYCPPVLRFTLFENNISRSVTLTDVSRNACSTCWIRSFQFERLVRPNLSTPIIQLLLSDIDDGSRTHQGSAVGSVDVANMGEDIDRRLGSLTQDVSVLNFLSNCSICARRGLSSTFTSMTFVMFAS
ncbi:hypothetical protein DPMN_080772 [Dreissena polymorpha]|uniref:Uncharacterized protein n=1 Tax=Dreissena polymorpha TaxID=45954 RepID=A0A9D3YVQ5_DREPO|nr:hypothetical protein DPMN_080772 [Dreissena polymorpha]